MKIVDYTILSALSCTALIDVVTAELANGWQPIGTPFCVDDSRHFQPKYCQAMVKVKRRWFEKLYTYPLPIGAIYDKARSNAGTTRG